MAVTRLENFRRWGHLTWPGDLTFGDLDLKLSGLLQNSCPNSCTKNGGAAAKKTRGCSNTPPPPPSWAQVNVKLDTTARGCKRLLVFLFLGPTRWLGAEIPENTGFWPMVWLCDVTVTWFHQVEPSNFERTYVASIFLRRYAKFEALSSTRCWDIANNVKWGKCPQRLVGDMISMSYPT